MKRFLFSLFIVFFSLPVAYATHNRSGEITFEQISNYRYRVKILTYTKTSSPADRPYLGIRWGDNTRDSLTRTGETAYPNDIKRNEYEGIHTYPGPGTYKIFVEDPNRNAGVVNIPGSVGVNFYIETELQIDPYRGAFNNSPRLLQPPIDHGSLNRIFIHNPNAYDPDGDSLSYELIPCKGAGGRDIPGYIRLDNNPTYSNISCTLDPVTGDFIWNTPQKEGEFNIAIRINEWRKDKNGYYKRIGYVIRDMQIEIEDFTNNPPPVLSHIKDTCIEAGTLLSFQVKGTDPPPSASKKVLLFATGGPLELKNNRAVFSFSSGNPASGTFIWQTRCENIRKQPYQVVFKAQDSLAFVDLKSMRITVVPPAPRNPVATPAGNTVTLHWNPDICPQAIGYKIYRKADSTAFDPANCETGLPAYTGFVLIDEVSGYYDTLYVDNNKGTGLMPGSKYCYRIVATFPEGVESYTSVQVCAELKKDIPIMAQASVLTTDTGNGTIRVAWTKPVIPDFDTTRAENAGPYKFELYRADNMDGTNPVLIKSFTSQWFSTFVDTVHVDGTLSSANTPVLNTTVPHSYFVRFYTLGTNLKGTASPASTILLSISPTDNRLNLSWTFRVPWNNQTYNIYRKDLSTGAFTLIGTSNTPQYSDSGLANLITRCYYIESVGALSGKGLPKNLLNNSQIACAAAIDNIVPCAPQVSAAADCDKYTIGLKWDNPNMKCADDVLSYRIYFKKDPKGPWPASPIDSIDATGPYSTQAFSFTHNSSKELLPGCYAVTSVDSVGNEGPKSNPACVECKPVYTLPNVFTPNNDGYNDAFRPFKDLRFIEKVDIKIFNRWGQLMFSSPHDPLINWDGTYNGKECSEGTYFYVAEVYEIRLEGVVSRLEKGFVELLRGGIKNSNVQ